MNRREEYKRILARLGYFDYQHGLIHRHLNQGKGWEAHLANCRRFILEAVDFNKPEKVTVLGSGWLLDLPLAELLDRQVKVILADIIHPPDVIKQVSGLRNVELLESDLTGGLVREVWDKAGRLPFFRKLDSLKDITIADFELPGGNPGLVISLNILSQLDVLPAAMLKKKAKASEQEINDFRRRVQDKHIEFLLRYHSVLITDTSEIFTDKAGKETEVKTVLSLIPPGKRREEWIWDFDKKRSDYFEKSSVMKITALIL